MRNFIAVFGQACHAVEMVGALRDGLGRIIRTDGGINCSGDHGQQRHAKCNGFEIHMDHLNPQERVALSFHNYHFGQERADRCADQGVHTQDEQGQQHRNKNQWGNITEHEQRDR